MFCHPQGVYGTAQDTHTTPSHFPAISCIFCVFFRVINRFPVFRLRPCYDFSLDFFRLFWFFGFRTRHGPLLRHPRHRHPGSDRNAIGAQIAALPANGFFWFRSFVKQYRLRCVETCGAGFTSATSASLGLLWSFYRAGSRGDEISCAHVFDMCCHGSVGTNTVLIHKTDELSFLTSASPILLLRTLRLFEQEVAPHAQAQSREHEANTQLAPT
eukprot:GEMP01076931.1.p1 GENE.GEMP01076931.1~~GEMP01076931.1.p1  ORF type:complete len:214 (-),score=23.71 GEMP01076931.1:40-681(-)